MSTVVCALDDIASGSAKRVTVGSTPIAIIRIGDDVYALHDKCTHGDVALSDGYVDEAACEIECARHSSMFNLKTGEPMTFPATQPVQVYVARVENGNVVVELESAQ
jgi:3-phenylpropionate/trans-cinnamate dioxygenase ferredoxin subunit